MRTLYFDCGMGAAGDMLTAALLELVNDKDSFIADLNDIGLPGVVYKAENSQKCGVSGTHVTVLVNGKDEGDSVQDVCTASDEHMHDHGEGSEKAHDHQHRSMADIMSIVNGLSITENVKEDILSVYRIIAEAESHVHNCPVSEIHFHEVGALDAIADVTAVCLLMERLSPGKVVASPIHVGSGTVRCAHGVLPVPAPATAYILRDVPIYSGDIQGELCTPTGAALLKYFVTDFGKMPVMKVNAIGYGMGKKDFAVANCVRALIGENEDSSNEISYEISANVDDMTAEQIGFATERIFDAGAAEVYTIPIGMKKSRPGILIRAICSAETRQAVIQAFFKHTSTIGIRESKTRRYVLSRSLETRDTAFGTVRIKHSEGYGVVKEKLEYEDLARIAKECGISVQHAKAAIEKELWKKV